MKNQKGFTLIEMVVVIVVLGILAVTAAPRFINIQSDARAATLDAAKGAVKAADGMVFAKAIMEGKEHVKDGNIIVNGKEIKLDMGHPHIISYNVHNIVDLDGFTVMDAAADSAEKELGFNGAVLISSKPAASEAKLRENGCYLSVGNSRIEESQGEVLFNLVTENC